MVTQLKQIQESTSAIMDLCVCTWVQKICMDSMNAK